jgi:hypothetical protein
MELDRDAIIRAVLGAIEAAKEQGAPAVMLRGWIEISKMLGYDKPEPPEERRNRPLSPGAGRLRARYESMSDNELLEILAAGE